MKRKLDWQKIIPMFLSMILTLFIFLNSFEIVFNYNLPLISAVDDVQLSALEQNYALEPGKRGVTFDTNLYGEPVSVRVSGGKAKVALAPGIHVGPTWLARSSTAHTASLIIPKSKVDNLFIYMRQNVRTIESVKEVVPGDNIFVDTLKGFRFIFRVSDVQILNKETPYVLELTTHPQLVVLIQDKKENTNKIITGNFVTRDEQ